MTERIDGNSVAPLPFWRSRLGRRLLGAILLFSSIVTFCLTAWDLLREYQSGMTSIRLRLDEVGPSYAGAAAAGLWAMDQRQLELLAQGIANLPAVRYVEIRDTISSETADISVQVGTPQDTRVEFRDIPLACECGGAGQRFVGNLHVEATLNELYSHLAERGLVILGEQILKTLLVASFILFIIHRMVGRKLLEISDAMVAFASGRAGSRLRLPDHPANDEVGQLVATFDALSERIVAREAELRLAKSQMEAILDNIPDLAWVKDAEGCYMAANRPLAVIFGHADPAELVGKTDFDLSPPDIARGYRAADLEVMASGTPTMIEELHVRTDGSTFQIETIKTPLRNADGAVIGTVGIARDITKRRQAEDALREANAKLEGMIGNLPGNIFRIRYAADNTRRLLFLDGGMERRIMAQYPATANTSSAEFLSRYHPDDIPILRDEVPGRLRRSGESQQTFRRLLADGAVLWLRAWERVVERSGDEMITEGITIDVSAEMAARDALEASEAMFRKLVSVTAVGVAGMTLEGRCTYVNDRMTDKTGMSQGELLERGFGEAIHPDDYHRVEAAWKQARRTAQYHRDEFRIVRRTDAQVIWVLAQGVSYSGGDGAPAGWIIALVDISERKTHELALVRLNRVLRTLGAGNETLLRSADEVSLYDEMCRTLVDTGGYRMACVALVEPEPEDSLRIAAFAGHEDGYLSQARLSRKDGGRGAGPSGMAIRTGAVQVNPDTATNPAMALWKDGALKRGYLSSIALPLRVEKQVFGCLNIYAAETNAFADEEVTLLTELSASFAYTISAMRERQRREEMEQQMTQAQRLEALGQLAGSVAHDFNNLLGAILGFANFIVEDSENDTPSRHHAARIVAAGQRGKALIGQILSFARKEELKRDHVDLGKLMEEVHVLLDAIIPVTTQLSVSADGTVPAIMGDREQIEQMLINLCINAHDALNGRPGQVRIAMSPTSGETLQLFAEKGCDGSVTRIWTAEDGTVCATTGMLSATFPHISLIVSDNGCGMGATVLPHVFKPFFTTKEKGHGTGLGLAMVHKAMLAHGGAILVKSLEAVGTTFELILPVCESAVAHPPPRGGAAPTPTLPAGIRLLLIDDDPDFGDMLLTALERKGFEVSPCSDPMDALEEFKEHGSVWDAVVADQTMPHMSGLDLIRSIRALGGTLPCILCTGYAADHLDEEQLREAGVFALLRKPVDLDELVGTISHAITDTGHLAGI